MLDCKVPRSAVREDRPTATPAARAAAWGGRRCYLARLALLPACQRLTHPVTLTARRRLEAALYKPAALYGGPGRPRQQGGAAPISAGAGGSTEDWATGRSTLVRRSSGPDGTGHRYSGRVSLRHAACWAGRKFVTRRATTHLSLFYPRIKRSLLRRLLTGWCSAGHWRRPSRQRAPLSAWQPGGRGRTWRWRAQPPSCRASFLGRPCSLLRCLSIARCQSAKLPGTANLTLPSWLPSVGCPPPCGCPPIFFRCRVMRPRE